MFPMICHQDSKTKEKVSIPKSSHAGDCFGDRSDPEGLLRLPTLRLNYWEVFWG
jgi:hypothetical protein